MSIPLPPYFEFCVTTRRLSHNLQPTSERSERPTPSAWQNESTPMSRKRSLLLLIPTAVGALIAAETAIFPLFRSTVPLGKQKDGFYLLPTNQLLRPWGQQVLIKGRPVDMAFNSDKRLIAVLNTRAILVFDALSGAQLADIKTRTTSYTGLAFRPGDRELWASETSRNGPDSIVIETLSDSGAPQKTDRIELTR